MDLIIYLLLLIVGLGFGLLTFLDRIFGILGSLISMIGGFYLLSDGTLIVNRVLVNNTTWISYTIPYNELSLLAILLGVVAAIDAILVIRLSG
jgi:hypothetical protein